MAAAAATHFSLARRAVFDTKRRITQRAKNTFSSGSEETEDDEFKEAKKLELEELKMVLIRLAASIKDFELKLGLMASTCLQMGGCVQELENGSGTGYKHADELNAALLASEQNGRKAQSTLKEAGASLARKIADFQSIEKMIVEYETCLLDVQAYERKFREASDAIKDGAKAGDSKTAKVKKVKDKLDKVRW